MDQKKVHFLDNSIARIDPENGHITYLKSCADILRDNGLEHLILRSGDPQDPLHLNDVEPTLFGDVCLTRRWGRIGAQGQMMAHHFLREEEAVGLFLELLRQKRNRGYRPTGKAAQA